MKELPVDPEPKKTKTRLFNILFLVGCAAILVFLLKAPPESTKKLPQDEIHLKFHAMDKKEAEKHCTACHAPEGQAPLPKDHPPKYRCLFCHKKHT
jgi:cytochrome c553